ncbi:MAG TPA: hypothetical protein VN702_08665 [Acetobacteraceae bacterium]|nr:hypothetical protein [Acetobacteraceae bacterium]
MAAAAAVANKPAIQRRATAPVRAVAPKTQPGPDGAAAAQGRVAELKVSGHLMNLEKGLFCVFQTPGSPEPDPATGLPGVRITPAPGSAGRPDAVSVTTFRQDGWLNGTGALVRVTDKAAQILVTVYQDGLHGPDSAPRLQVLRLRGDGATAPVAAPAAPAAEPEVVAHVQRTGDIGAPLGEWIGKRGSRLWLEGFGLSPKGPVGPQDIEYQAVLGRGWLSPWVEGGKLCGSRGMALPLLGLNVRLKGDAAKDHDCTYSATFVDGTAVGPVQGGQTCEAESLAALEAFQISIHPRGKAPPIERKPNPRAAKAKTPAKPTRR